MAAAGRERVFICYSRSDKAWLQLLLDTMSPLLRQQTVSVWWDGKTQAGDKWRREIDAALASVPVAVLLVSRDFLASDFIQNIELPYLLDAAETKGVKLLWVPIGHCLYDATPIGDYQAVIEPETPLNEMGVGERDRALVAICKTIAAAMETAEPGGPASPARISIERLPLTGEHFFGREDELARLDAAWADDHTHVLSIVAWGGAGKSTLVNGWLARLAGEDWRGAERVFGWSFYSQGSKAQQATSADLFIDEALRWLGETKPPPTPWERGRRLAALVRQQRTLLVLDGLEPMQHPPGPQEGRLKDPALQALVRGLAADNRGLCLITTRLAVADVAHLSGSMAPRLALERLSTAAGVALLGRLGVVGSEKALAGAVERFEGHALALALLGSYLHTAYEGDVRRMEEVPVGAADEHAGGHAFRVIEAYAHWFGPASPEVAVLRLLGLFDRPAPGAAIAALRAAPAIPGLTAPAGSLAKLRHSIAKSWRKVVGGRKVGTSLPALSISDPTWRTALSRLRACGLLAPADSEDGEALDAHPLVHGLALL